MKPASNWATRFLLVFLGIIVFLGLLFLVFLGGVLGTYLYLKSAPIKTTITYPMIDDKGVRRDITVNLATEKALPRKDLESMLKQGQVRGFVQVRGPRDGQLLAFAFTIQLPMEQIVKEAAIEVRKEMGLSREGDMTSALMSRFKMEMGLPEGKTITQGFIESILKQLFSPLPALPR